MDNFLFIGGAGFLGSAIIKELLAQDAQANIVVLEPPQADISRLDGCNVRIIRGTLQETALIDSIITVHGVTQVVHLVSTMKPDSIYAAHMTEYNEVVRPSVSLMNLCADRSIKLVYFSSGGAVYGKNKNGKPLKEDAILNPISIYGMSKQLMEELIETVHYRFGLQYLILRPSNPYGHGQYMYGRQGLIAVAFGRVLTGCPIEIWGDGSAVRDYIYIDDFAKAVCAVIKSGAVNEAINIGSGTGTTVNDVLGIVGDVVGKPLKVWHAGRRRQDVSRVVLDVARMRQIYQQPLTGIKEGIKTFWTDLLSRNNEITI